MAVVGWSGRSALATPVTYNLSSGNLTSVFVGGTEQLTGGPVALTSASATIDFTSLQMSNLFVGASSVGFTLANSTSPIALFGGPSYIVGDAPVSAALNGTALTGLNLAGSTIALTNQGLNIVMTGLTSSGAAATVKVDFDFVARSTNGATAIPEPGSELLLPAGLALLGLILRGRRSEASC